MSRLVVLCCLVLLTQAVPAYDLWFVQNEEFASSLAGWFTCDPNFDFPHERGTAEWSSEHDGSAHLSISGAPGNICLLTTINTTIYPGDIIRMHLTKSNTEGFGQFDLGIGWNSLFMDQVSAPGDSGEFVVDIVSSHCYLPGTVVGVLSCVWPGSAQAWIHYVSLHRDGSGVLEPSGPRRTKDVARSRGVHPNPATTSVSFSIDAPTAGKARVRVFDIRGGLVADFEAPCRVGTNSAQWDIKDASHRRVAAGTYLYAVKMDGQILSKGKVVVAE